MEPNQSTSSDANSKRNRLIAIGGQTATGKTSLSIEVAKKFNCEIISADSRQVYKYLDIGTAKPEIERKLPDGTAIIQGIPHHLIDILEPDEEFNLAAFKKLALEKIAEILQRDETPIIAGGTGLYIDSVLKNYSLPGDNIDHKSRTKLQKMSVQKLCSILSQTSPETLESMTPSDRKNKHRLIRAIEKTHAQPAPSKNSDKSFDYLYLVKNQNIDSLTEEINDRVDRMFGEGLLEENIELRKKGYSTSLISMKTIGYQEFDDYFAEKISLEEVKNLIKIHTRQYAKRQITWFKRNLEAVWVKNDTEAIGMIADFLES